MYDKDDRNQIPLSAFSMPFDGKLKASDRWIKLSKKIEWEKIEDEYSSRFSTRGTRAVKCRVVYAAILIKEILGISDRETLLQISENPYMQYLCGYTEFQTKCPFSYKTMSRFRKRFSPDMYSNKYIKTLISGKGTK